MMGRFRRSKISDFGIIFRSSAVKTFAIHNEKKKIILWAVFVFGVLAIIFI